VGWIGGFGEGREGREEVRSNGKKGLEHGRGGMMVPLGQK
jgi:hypothetical protein